MIIGYIISNVLGLALAISLIALRSLPRTSLGDHYIFVLTKGFIVFFDCAIYFSFAVQIASMIELWRVMNGLHDGDVGPKTVSITLAISTLTMLPSLYALYTPMLFQIPVQDSRAIGNIRDTKQPLRIVLIMICLLLTICVQGAREHYSFGECTHDRFGRADRCKRSEDEEIELARKFEKIHAICLARAKTPGAGRLVENVYAFGMIQCVLIAFAVTCKILRLWYQRRRHQRHSKDLEFRMPIRYLWAAIIVCLLLIFAIVQLLAILWLRNEQLQMAKVSGTTNSDGDWTFGQVVAVTLFTPVLFECWSHWKIEKHRRLDALWKTFILTLKVRT